MANIPVIIFLAIPLLGANPTSAPAPRRESNVAVPARPSKAPKKFCINFLRLLPSKPTASPATATRSPRRTPPKNPARPAPIANIPCINFLGSPPGIVATAAAIPTRLVIIAAPTGPKASKKFFMSFARFDPSNPNTPPIDAARSPSKIPPKNPPIPAPRAPIANINCFLSTLNFDIRAPIPIKPPIIAAVSSENAPKKF